MMMICFGLLTTSQRRHACCDNRMLRRWEHLSLFAQSMHQILMPHTLILGISLSLLLHAVVVAAIIVIANAFGVPSEQLLLVACAAPLGLIATMLPISIAGHGIRETAFVYFLSNVGIVPEIGLTISVSLYGIMAFASLVGGGMYLFNAVIQKSYAKYLEIQHAIMPSRGAE
jgi:hypothetical protein